MEFKFNHGDFVYDTITEFSGTVVGRADYPNKDKKYLIQPNYINNGVMADSQWVPEWRLSKEKTFEEIGYKKKRENNDNRAILE